MEEHEYTMETPVQEYQDQAAQESTEPEVQDQEQSFDPSMVERPVQTISDKEKNFKNLKEERDRWRQRAQELEARVSAPQAPQKPYDPEELADRRYVDNRINEISIRYKYPDYDQVVNTDTIEKLKKEDPYLAYSIGTNPDSYSQSIAVYNAIKRYGLAGDDYQKGRDHAQANLGKPRPTNSISPSRGDSPLSHANAFSDGPLTDQQMEALRKEMHEARKRR